MLRLRQVRATTVNLSPETEANVVRSQRRRCEAPRVTSMRAVVTVKVGLGLQVYRCFLRRALLQSYRAAAVISSR